MKAIILAAGYATRLYPLTLNRPKALLSINDRVVLDYIVDKIESLNQVDEIFIVSNNRFFNQFIEWKKQKSSLKNILILNDESTSEGNKLGAVGDIQYAINKANIDDDVLILSSDNLFTYNLEDFYNYYRRKKSDCVAVSAINDIKELQRMGVVNLSKEGIIINFEEKPINPRSKIGAYATYIFQRSTLKYINCYLLTGNNNDAPGYFLEWLCRKKIVYGYKFDGESYDIGTIQSYNDIINKKF